MRRRGSFIHGTATGWWHHECTCSRCEAAMDNLTIDEWAEMVRS